MYRRVFVTFPANEQKCFLSFCKWTSFSPQYSPQRIVDLLPEDLFFFWRSPLWRQKIGGSRTEDFFLNIVFACFVLSLTLSVAVCRRIQLVLKVCRRLKNVAEHCSKPASHSYRLTVSGLMNFSRLALSIMQVMSSLILLFSIQLLLY